MKTHLLKTMLVIALVAFGAAAVQAGAKVQVCHLPPGNPYNWHTITISVNALDAHLNHGDVEGSCLANCDELCDDDDACTQDVQYDPEECLCRTAPRPPVDCDDGLACTVDRCDSQLGCTVDSEILNGTLCDDGDPNTSDDQCMAGVCEGCACDDGLFCDGVETINGSGRCEAGMAPCDVATETCNETDDVCEALGDCQSDDDCNPITACFSETCNTGKCVREPLLDCFALQTNPCTIATCDPVLGCQFPLSRTCPCQGHVCVPINVSEWSCQAP